MKKVLVTFWRCLRGWYLGKIPVRPTLMMAMIIELVGIVQELEGLKRSRSLQFCAFFFMGEGLVFDLYEYISMASRIWSETLPKGWRTTLNFTTASLSLGFAQTLFAVLEYITHKNNIAYSITYLVLTTIMVGFKIWMVYRETPPINVVNPSLRSIRVDSGLQMISPTPSLQPPLESRLKMPVETSSTSSSESGSRSRHIYFGSPSRTSPLRIHDHSSYVPNSVPAQMSTHLAPPQNPTPDAFISETHDQPNSDNPQASQDQVALPTSPAPTLVHFPTNVSDSAPPQSIDHVPPQDSITVADDVCNSDDPQGSQDQVLLSTNPAVTPIVVPPSPSLFLSRLRQPPPWSVPCRSLSWSRPRFK